MSWKYRITTYAGCLAFTLLGVWLLTEERLTSLYPAWAVRIVAIICILFFGGGGLFAVYKDIKISLQHRKPVEFTDEGISIVGEEVIVWSQIEGFEPYTFKGTDLILIKTKNPELTIHEQTSWLKRKILQLNLDKTGALYSISLMLMKGSKEDVLRLCEQELDRHRLSSSGRHDATTEGSL